MKAAVLVLGVFVFGVAAPVQAQMKWTDKGFAAVDLGVQAGSKSFDSEITFDLYPPEVATVQTSRDGKAGFFFDIRGGYKVWRNLAVGLGVSRVATESDVAVSASVPDPIEFDHPRQVTLTAPDASRTETALHISGTWMIPFTDKIDIGIVGGPSVFFIKNDSVTSLSVSENPFSATANLESASETAVGFHIGADVQYMLNKKYGVGGLLRYAWGKADFPGGEVTAGGLQIGAGLRMRF